MIIADEPSVRRIPRRDSNIFGLRAFALCGRSRPCFAGAVPKRESILRLGRFLAVGGIAAAVDFAALSLLHVMLAPTAAFSAAFAAGVVTHFLLNKYWTFRCARTDFLRQIAEYLLVVALNYVMQLIVFRGVLAAWPGAGVYLAKAAALPPGTVLGFFLFKKHVFKRHPLPGSTAS
jgi:putative flippase GtrA